MHELNGSSAVYGVISMRWGWLLLFLLSISCLWFRASDGLVSGGPRVGMVQKQARELPNGYAVHVV